LEAGDDGDVPGCDRVSEPVAPDLEDLGLAVHGVGEDAGLAARERRRLDAELGERHAQQRHRLALARGEQHVHLAAGLHRRHLVCQRDELVGLLAHRADDDDHVVALAVCACDVLGDGPDPLGIGNRRAAVLLHEKAHAVGRYQCRLWGHPGKPVGSPARGHRKT
jgi:hypothetical protein